MLQCKYSKLGPGGVFEGEGREFRYPVTFRDQEGNKIKKHNVEPDFSKGILLDGHYAFGANELHIMAALNEILDYLEKEYDIEIEKKDFDK